VPLPFPLLPEPIVIQFELLVAVQEQPLGAVIPMLSTPPSREKDALAGEIE
jgi:hypothetical protein